MNTITPPQLAKQWAISPDKVLAWIRTGELRAFNAATKPGGRPIYRIAPDALEEFIARRTPVKAEKKTRRPQVNATQYY